MRSWSACLVALMVLMVADYAVANPAPKGKSFRDCPNCPELVTVPAGSFAMGVTAADETRMGLLPGAAPLGHGDTSPVHTVTFKESFAVGKYPVTRGQFRAFVDETGHKTKDSCYTLRTSQGRKVYEEYNGYTWRDPGVAQTDEHPVVCVNWYDAKAYTDWLTKKTGHVYRLLSEAEYEYSNRAGTTTLFFWGDDRNGACTYANVADLTQGRSLGNVPMGGDFRFQCEDRYADTSPVGSFKPNPFGLYDMTGNIHEWVEDCWHPNYEGAPADGSPWMSGVCDMRVWRGGSNGNSPFQMHAGARLGRRDPEYRGHTVGFRVVRLR